MNKLKKIYTNIKLYLLFKFYKLMCCALFKKEITIRNKTFEKINFEKYLNFVSNDTTIRFINCQFENCTFNNLNPNILFFCSCLLYDCRIINPNINELIIRSSIVTYFGNSKGNIKHIEIYGTNINNSTLFSDDLNNTYNFERATFDFIYFDLKKQLKGKAISCHFNGCAFYDLSTEKWFEENAIKCKGIYLNCPEKGSFIAYRTARFYKDPKKDIWSGFCVVKVLVTNDAKRAHSKCADFRVSKVKVLELQDYEGNVLNGIAKSLFGDPFNSTYIPGNNIEFSDFEENLSNSSSKGIHLFINRMNAVNY